LSLVTDELGEITPFAVIGEDNTEVEKRISALEAQIGTDDPPSALKKSLHQASTALNNARADWKSAVDGLEMKMPEKANRKPGGIKHNPLFRDPTYNISKIRADISTVREANRAALDEETSERLRRVLGEKSLPDLVAGEDFEPRVEALITEVDLLTGQALLPSRPVEELLSDPQLQSWAKSGIPLHRGRRATCGFCTSKLTDEAWKRLDDHLDEASSVLDAELDSVVQRIEDERIALSKIKTHRPK
jgi:hypothetical protein